jgi:hypothetical protein
MDNVLNIADRIKDKKRKERVEAYRNRIETVHKVVQCSSCHYKCAMCGHHLGDIDSSCPSPSSQSGFNLCECCQEEFNDFFEISRGRKGSDIFWHNKEWMKLWSTWLDYHRAIREFRNSTEFEQLTDEYDI